MAKMISAKDLAELFHQALLGGLIDDANRFSAFMTDAAALIADHCGGEVGNPASCSDGEWMISIYPNDSLPGDGGVWKNCDPDVLFINGVEVDQSDASECQNCGDLLHNDSLKEIDDLSQRVAAGEPAPSGECPHCGALCHPYDPVARHSQSHLGDEEPSWEIVAAFFGLDPSFQYNDADKAAYIKSFKQNQKRRVLVYVKGGVASYAGDDGVDVEIFDQDNCDAGDDIKCPAHFADLAKVFGVPVEGDAS